MENRTEIGKAIKNKLDNLDKSPNDFVWSRIETDLNKKRNKRLLYWLIPSILAILLGSSALYFNLDFQNKDPKQKTEIKKNTKNEVSAPKSNQNSKPKLNYKSSPQFEKSGQDEIITIRKNKSVKLIKQTNKLVTSTNEYEEYEVVKKYKVVIKKEQISTKPLKLAEAKKSTKPEFKKNKTVSVKKVSPKKTTKTPIINHNEIVPEKPIITDSSKENESEQKKSEGFSQITTPEIDTIIETDSSSVKKKTTPKREYKKTVYNTAKDELKPEFTLSVFYGPALFGSLNDKSMINPAMDGLSKSHPITSHYGFYLKTMYDKIGFRAGFSKINLKIATRLEQNLIPNYNNIELNSQINIKETFSNSNQVDLIQKLSYYEFPIEFDYAIKKDESKIGVDIFTGLSLLILDKNELSLKSENVVKQNIGEAKNISGANFSYNLGLGISYKLNNRFNLDINPLFKYYLSTFNENGEAKPYSFSLQSGVSYKF